MANAGHLGQMLAEVRRAFTDARSATPRILFIDEIGDAGSRGDAASQSRSYQTHVINDFPEDVDKFARDAVGKTPAGLDAAIRAARAGRSAMGAAGSAKLASCKCVWLPLAWPGIYSGQRVTPGCAVAFCSATEGRASPLKHAMPGNMGRRRNNLYGMPLAREMLSQSRCLQRSRNDFGGAIDPK